MKLFVDRLQVVNVVIIHVPYFLCMNYESYQTPLAHTRSLHGVQGKKMEKGYT